MRLWAQCYTTFVCPSSSGRKQQLLQSICKIAALQSRWSEKHHSKSGMVKNPMQGTCVCLLRCLRAYSWWEEQETWPEIKAMSVCWIKWDNKMLPTVWSSNTENCHQSWCKVLRKLCIQSQSLRTTTALSRCSYTEPVGGMEEQQLRDADYHDDGKQPQPHHVGDRDAAHGQWSQCVRQQRQPEPGQIFNEWWNAVALDDEQAGKNLDYAFVVNTGEPLTFADAIKLDDGSVRWSWRSSRCTKEPGRWSTCWRVTKQLETIRCWNWSVTAKVTSVATRPV